MTDPNAGDEQARRDHASTTFPDDRFVREFVNAVLAEQRRARRWGIFFKSLIFLYLFAILLISVPSDWLLQTLGMEKHTALVEINGIIGSETEASADNVVSGLRAAFEDDNTAGLILRINSPGGSAVQAGYINDEIARLREKHPEIPVYAVIVDVCASGGYYIAAAADEIYADKASLVGSIGVRYDGFGFVEAMEKIGIERRLITAGANKGFLDPFQPLKPDEVEHIKGVLADVHKQFINTVKRGRRGRLVDDERLYSGLIWTGEQGLEMGLVDALGSSSYVAREVIGEEKIVDFTVRDEYLLQLTRKLTSAFARALIDTVTLR
jgi:protease-4